MADEVRQEQTPSTEEQQEAAGIAEQMSAAAEQPQEQESQPEETTEQPRVLTIDDIREVVKAEVGRVQGGMAQRVGELRKEVKELLDENFAPLRRQQEMNRLQSELQQFETSEERERYLLGKVNELTSTSTTPRQEQQQPLSRS